MKYKKITLEDVANILEESVEWVKSQIDNGKFGFAYKCDTDTYFIDRYRFERYLLSSQPYFLKVHNSRRYK